MIKQSSSLLEFLRGLPQESTQVIPGKFNVTHFLQQLDGHYYLPEDLENLEKLCKKVDVVKRVFQYYDLELRKKMAEEEVSLLTCHRLACHLLLGFAQSRNYKLLNSLLKIGDGILQIPAYKMSADLQVLTEKFIDEALKDY